MSDEMPTFDGVPMPISIDNLTPAQFAMYLAVLHHGMACSWQSPDSKPASRTTVANTASFFYTQIRQIEQKEGGR